MSCVEEKGRFSNQEVTMKAIREETGDIRYRNLSDRESVWVHRCKEFAHGMELAANEEVVKIYKEINQRSCRDR